MPECPDSVSAASDPTVASRAGADSLRCNPEATEAVIKIERLGISSKALNEFLTTIYLTGPGQQSAEPAGSRDLYRM